VNTPLPTTPFPKASSRRRLRCVGSLTPVIGGSSAPAPLTAANRGVDTHGRCSCVPSVERRLAKRDGAASSSGSAGSLRFLCSFTLDADRIPAIRQHTSACTTPPASPDAPLAPQPEPFAVVPAVVPARGTRISDERILRFDVHKVWSSDKLKSYVHRYLLGPTGTKGKASEVYSLK
jgi:hypothetical protein